MPVINEDGVAEIEKGRRRVSSDVASRHPPCADTRPADDPTNDDAHHRPRRHRRYAEGTTTAEDQPARATTATSDAGGQASGSKLDQRDANDESLTINEVRNDVRREDRRHDDLQGDNHDHRNGALPGEDSESEPEDEAHTDVRAPATARSSPSH